MTDYEFFEDKCKGWIKVDTYHANEAAIDRLHGLWTGVYWLSDDNHKICEMIDRYADVAKARRDDLRGGA